MLSVSWSDQNQVLVYRTFEEFKTLHKGLKRKFPIESGLLKKSDRTLPRFRDANAVLRKNQKLSRCMESLRLLEVYCQELLKTQAKISQGEDVITFLEAQSQDLEPSFPENSVIILPSEMGEKKKEPPRTSSLTITQPVVSQIYQCVAPFRTRDTQNKPFEATQAEKLEVLMKDPTGWWLVENKRKQIAWFPAPYLEDSKEIPVMEENNEEGMLYYVTQAYRAKEPDELSIKTGIVVEVLEKSDSGWWLAWYDGTAGFIPSMFLQPYRNPHSKFLALASRSLCSSLPNLTEAPGLSSKNFAAQQKRNQVYLNQMMQSKDTGSLEGKGVRSPTTAATIGSSSSTSETDSWSSSSGNVSDQGFCGPSDPESNIVLTESYHQTPGSPGSSSVSKQQNNSGSEEETSRDPVHPLPSGMCPLPRGPVVPPRPSPHEILQKCSSPTRRALQRSLEQPSGPACSHVYS
ncbi:NADPH oxidase organizer 1 isoform X1 [Python bivittatus]|uniref:NADPH oxidase organizer 1 isoform X1 n=2 Tax=Python bivittatus TaxID=176946 RepID=A0A9F2R7M2_PYTBI|nr:NADPH oxidase organizer 1 isoform X1 [Python bivittatus]